MQRRGRVGQVLGMPPFPGIAISTCVLYLGLYLADRRAGMFGLVATGSLLAMAATAAGALGAALAARMGRWRGIGILPAEAVSRVAEGAILPMAAVVWLTRDMATVGNRPLIAAIGVLCAFAWGAFGRFVSTPERHYLRALVRWRAGDRAAARAAVQQYLRTAEHDPRRAERLSLAERFLEDEGASLEPTAELVAATAPAGRGTEPEAAVTPAGRGTEPEAAEQEPAADTAGHKATAEMQRRRQ